MRYMLHFLFTSIIQIKKSTEVLNVLSDLDKKMANSTYRIFSDALNVFTSMFFEGRFNPSQVSRIKEEFKYSASAKVLPETSDKAS